jgi:hypothetical protein
MARHFPCSDKDFTRYRLPGEPNATAICTVCGRWHFYDGKARRPAYWGFGDIMPPTRRERCICPDAPLLEWKERA